jgi:hypothetical protein
MRIWRFADPDDHRFAVSSRIGTWEERNGVCIRVPPLVIEWERGPTLIGDFVWPYVSELVVQEHVFRTIEREFGGIKAEGVEIVPLKRKPKKAPEDGNLHTWSDRLDLVGIQIMTHVNADPDRSTRQLIVREDGQTEYEFEGIEHVEWNRVRGDLLPERKRVPRMPGTGIFVKSCALAGQSLFKVRQCPAWNFCTDRVRDFILGKRFTNVDFYEMGELL